MNIRSVIVTGGSGFVGSHLIRRLRTVFPDATIYVLDVARPNYSDESIVFVECDIRRPIDWRLDQRDYPLVCFHLGALCKEPGYDWDDYFETNVRGTENVVRWCASNHVKSIVFTSTMMVFRASEEMMYEDSLKSPDTAYGISKLVAEHVLQEWLAASPDRRLRIVRPAVVFGLGENGNFTRLFQALRRRRFAYVGRTDTVKSCVYVKDLVDFLLFVNEDDGDWIDYNFALPETTRIRDIVHAMLEVAGLRRRPMTVPFVILSIVANFLTFWRGSSTGGTFHPRRVQKLKTSTWISSDRARKAGFEYRYTLKTALVDWWFDSGATEFR